MSPVVAGMAGMLSLMGLLSDPQREQMEAEQRAEQRAAEQAAAALAPAPLPVAEPAAADALAAIDESLDGAVEEAQVPAGRSPSEALQAAAAADMAEVDMRAARSAALRARQPPKPLKDPAELKPRHTARPELTAKANARHAPPPPPVTVPPPVPEAAPGAEEYDANVALSMQVGWRSDLQAFEARCFVVH